MKLHDIDPDNRPRERFLQHGAAALSPAELLALILRSGSQQYNILDTCHHIINRFSLEKLSDVSLKELQQIKGIGESKAMQIVAIFELNRRLHYSRNQLRKIMAAGDVFEYMSGRIPDESKEHLFVLHLNTKNQVIKNELISIGTLNTAVIHPREIFKSAIRESAHSIIVVHNHPSGDVNPSNADKKITNELKQAGAFMQIEMLDHVIMSKTEWYSFRERGLL
jgi:DNA repair protein RadC|uniref:UPF0758 protein Cag_1513 n=1 Tax=Chlorobium chlorochromatii (strain CaD3) TaxID=340177 RepID=Y1513_CHLCH|nr:RecName: Full=UPF0758 protein Cag_1513 [Chlorobium chlorochromatii CaD3]